MAGIFLQLAEKVLNEAIYPLSPTEIWDIAIAKGIDKELHTDGKTPWATLSASLYVDVRDNSKSLFVCVGERPKKFALKTMIKEHPVMGEEGPEKVKPELSFLEKDLHALLVYYAYKYLHLFLKTIDHTKSGKKEFSEWVHPDLVGCYYPYNDLSAPVLDVSSLLGNIEVKLYSFELKRRLSFSNIREAFFQSVSNSSWANYGYLVAAMIDKNEDFLSELQRLSSSFGIGIIQLNTSEPDSSEILFPAQEKVVIDWVTVNKLANLNSDFSEFLDRLKKDMKGREIRSEKYDKVLEIEELKKKFKKSD